jgi:hypothetical protein
MSSNYPFLVIIEDDKSWFVNWVETWRIYEQSIYEAVQKDELDPVEAMMIMDEKDEIINEWKRNVHKIRKHQKGDA